VEIKPMKELDAGYQPELNPPLPNLEDKTTQATSAPRLSLVTLPSTRAAAQPAAQPARQLDDSGWHAAGR
jgi:hypothetical protein